MTLRCSLIKSSNEGRTYTQQGVTLALERLESDVTSYNSATTHNSDTTQHELWLSMVDLYSVRRSALEAWKGRPKALLMEAKRVESIARRIDADTAYGESLEARVKAFLAEISRQTFEEIFQAVSCSGVLHDVLEAVASVENKKMLKM